MRERPTRTAMLLDVMLLLVFALLPGCGLSSAEPTRFPGNAAKLISPNGLYVLFNIDSDQAPFHKLILRNLSTGRERTLQTYTRHVSVCWSPQGENLFVNDYGGSDYSDCYVYMLNCQGPRRSMKEALKNDFPKGEHLWGNHHVYIECTRWLSETKVLIHVHGYGEIDPSGFEACFSFELAGHVQPMECSSNPKK